MTYRSLLAVSFALLIGQQSANAQGISESAAAGGAGAGLAAAFMGGKKRPPPPKTKRSQLSTEMSAAELEQLKKTGEQLEKNKNWPAAEECYRRCLAAASKSGAVGSANGLWILEHLSSVCSAQHKTDEAIGLSKTAATVTQGLSGESSPATISAKQRLADFFIAKNDYDKAANYLGEAVTSADKAEHKLPDKQMLSLLVSYSSVLSELGRKTDAAAMESRASSLRAAAVAPAPPDTSVHSTGSASSSPPKN